MNTSNSNGCRKFFHFYLLKKWNFFIILISTCHFKSSKIKNKCSIFNALKGLGLKRNNKEINKHELLYTLSLEKRWESKLDNKKESSILIEDSYYIAMKFDEKVNLVLIKNLVFAMKIELKINLLFNIWYYIAMKNDLKVNSILEKWILYTVGKSTWKWIRFW